MKGALQPFGSGVKGAIRPFIVRKREYMAGLQLQDWPPGMPHPANDDVFSKVAAEIPRGRARRAIMIQRFIYFVPSQLLFPVFNLEITNRHRTTKSDYYLPEVHQMAGRLLPANRGSWKDPLGRYTYPSDRILQEDCISAAGALPSACGDSAFRLCKRSQIRHSVSL
jgi:hypothetical protein